MPNKATESVKEIELGQWVLLSAMTLQTLNLNVRQYATTPLNSRRTELYSTFP